MLVPASKVNPEYAQASDYPEDHQIDVGLLQVCMAADEGLGALLPEQPSAVCLPLLKANLPGQGTVNSPACQPTPLIHVSHPECPPVV